MALFSACVCQFGKRFDLFLPLVSFDYEDLIEVAVYRAINDRQRGPIPIAIRASKSLNQRNRPLGLEPTFLKSSINQSRQNLPVFRQTMNDD